jgi:hypothetical protein
MDPLMFMQLHFTTQLPAIYPRPERRAHENAQEPIEQELLAESQRKDQPWHPVRPRQEAWLINYDSHTVGRDEIESRIHAKIERERAIPRPEPDAEQLVRDWRT